VDRAARLGSTVERGGVDKRARRLHADVRRAGVRAHQCSPEVVEEDEPDEAVLEGCSPEHELQRRGGVTEVKNGDGLRSARGRWKEPAGFSGGVVVLSRRRRRVMTGGAHLSARRGEAGALSCDGGGNRVGRQRSTQACWAGRGRQQPRKEWASVAGWAKSIGKKKKNQKSFDFRI
jgi:hypothetical protein